MRPIYVLCASSLVLAACSTDNLDLDLRGVGQGFDTSAALQANTAPPPRPDNRGVISYPNYQVVAARRGDTVADVANRIGVPAASLARYNGVPENTPLNQGEILALPQRVAEPSAATGALGQPGSVDIQTLAGNAITQAGSGTTPSTAAAAGQSAGPEPTRHKVVAGETAYSIARLYGVSAKSLGEWNGLGPDLGVRTGQFLLIPVVVQPQEGAAAGSAASTTAPGQGSPTPTPPSAKTPLPDEKTIPTAKASDPENKPESPNLAKDKTSASNARMVSPVDGSIVRDFSKGKNDGIDISAASGAPVKAADAGTVAAITQDTDQVPIVVLRHKGGLLTVYANVDGLKVKKGQSVKRGQQIATVRAASSPFLHFEVREGVDAVDPTPFLQ